MQTSPTGECSTRAGFTLLEMLVAITISAIILAAAYGTFATASRTQRTLDAHDARLQNLRCACAALQQDLRSAVPPPPKQAGKDRWTDTGCAFTIQAGPHAQAVVRYDFREGKLMRSFEPVREPGSSAKPAQEKSEAPVAEDVSGVEFGYFAEKSWQNQLRPKQWPESVRLALRLGPGKKEQAPLYQQVIRIEAR